MPGETLTLSRPDAGADLRLRVPEGQTPSLGFPASDIREFHLTASGALEIRLEGNSLIVIENFRDLAARGAKISVPDGQAIDANLIYNTLAADSAPEGKTALFIPRPGDTLDHAYTIESGKKYILGFDAGGPESADRLEGALVLGFQGGGTVILRNFAAVESGALPPEMTLADGVAVPAGRLPEMFGRPAAEAPAMAMAEAAPEAARLASIEPAAGPSAAPAFARAAPPADAQRTAATNSGYGLRSTADSIDLSPVTPVGPIDPTALRYTAPEVKPEIYDLPQSRPTPPIAPLRPTLTVGDALVLEDGSTALSLGVTPSESGTTLSISIGGIPSTWGVSGPGSYDPATGLWTVTLSPGTPFPGGPILSPPADSDADLTGLTVTVTESDPGTGRDTTVTDTIDVITDAVADAPIVAAQGATGNEDETLPLVINPSVTDTDGSESITAIYVRGVPAGFTLSAGTDNGAGVWQLTPAQLSGLKVLAPLNYSGQISLQIEVISEETTLSGIEPDLTNNQASALQTVTLKWCPLADEPDLRVSDAQVKEDGTVFVPVSATLADRDGSESLSVTVSGVPSGWTFTGASWTPTGTAGQYRVTLPAGTDYTGGFTLKPPANSDADIGALQIKATATETIGGDTADTLRTIRVTTDAVADVPTIDGVDRSGPENTARTVTLNAALTDTDGSESITEYRISGVPTGFSFNQGTDLGGGVWSFTPAQIVGLSMSSPAGFVGSVPLTATVFSGETILSGGEYDPSDNTAQASDPFTLTWKPVANPPTVQVNNGVDDAIVKEDGSVFVPIRAALDPAGSGREILTVTVTGLNPAWTILNTDGTYNPATGTWTITLPAGENYTGGLTFKPPANSDADLSGLNATAQAFEPVTGTNASASDAFRIVADAVADVPNLSASDATGEEGRTIPLSISTSVTDTDGSETIAFLRISNLPAGASLNRGAEVSPGVWEISPADLPGLGVVVPNGVTGAYNLDVTSFSRETNLSGTEVDLTDNTASRTVRIELCIEEDDSPILVQPETISVDETNLGPITVNDAAAADFGADMPGTFRATGASSFSASGSVAGGVLTSGGVPVTVALAGNTYTGTAGGETIFTLAIQSNGQYQFRLLGTLDHANGSDPNDVIALRFGITATDSETDSTNGFITVNVADDGLLAHDDVNEFSRSAGGATGNVIMGTNGGAGAADDTSNDQPNMVTRISFGSTTVDVPAVGVATIAGAHGILQISADGTYEYVLLSTEAVEAYGRASSEVQTDSSRYTLVDDSFRYTLADSDADTSDALLTLRCKAPPVTVSVTVNNGSDDVVVKEDGSVFVPVSAQIGDGDGNEILTLTLEGVGPGWVLTGAGWAPTGVPGQFKITLPPGADYMDGFTLRPPANSDADLSGLKITASVSDPDSAGASAFDLFRVVTDAVADVPNLTVTGATGAEDTALSLVINPSVTDTDGSESITAIYVRGVPAGFALSAGTNNGGGVWQLTPAQLSGLKVLAPLNYSGQISLQVEAIARETTLSGTETDLTDNQASRIQTVQMTWSPDADAPGLVVQDALVKEDGTVFVPVSATLADRDGSESLSVTVSGVPSGWSFTGASWAPTGTAGQYRVTLPAGTDYTGGFTLKPPANSDADIGALQIKATATETIGGDSADTLRTIRVTTDAVADVPNLWVDCPCFNGINDGIMRFSLDIQTGVTDMDGSESISKIIVSGLPDEWDLSTGTRLPDGSWQLTKAQLPDLEFYVPVGESISGHYVIRVTSWSEETSLSGNEVDYSDNMAFCTHTIDFNLNINTNTNTNTNVNTNINFNGSDVDLSAFAGLYNDDLDDLFLPAFANENSSGTAQIFALSDVLHNPDSLSEAINDFVYGAVRTASTGTPAANLSVNTAFGAGSSALDLVRETEVVA